MYRDSHMYKPKYIVSVFATVLLEGLRAINLYGCVSVVGKRS